MACVPAACSRGTNGCRLANSRPGNRRHLGRGVQLHGAGAERNHAVHQRVVAVLQALEVAHHLGFAAVAVEHRVRKDGVGAPQRGRDRFGSRARACAPSPRRSNGRPVSTQARSATSSSVVVSSSVAPTRSGASVAQVDALLPARAPHRGGIRAPGERVEVSARDSGRQRARQQARHQVHAQRDPAQALRRRARPRRTPRRWRAAPARCRCCSSPFRGGCAARASAAPCVGRCGPAASRVTPTMRPGICRSRLSRAARKPGCGPP